MSKTRIVVITDPATAEGFMLTGIEVRPFVDPRAASQEVQETIQSPDTDILVVNDSFLENAHDSVKRHMKGSTPPVIISLPVMRTKGRASRDSIDVALGQINMFSREGPKKEVPTREFEHHTTRHDVEAKPCTVCGHMLEPGMRICTSCGSIRRSVRARGLRTAPAKKGSCRTCGVEISGDRVYCDECAGIQKKKAEKAREEAAPKVAKPARESTLKALIEAVKNLFRRLFGRNRPR